MALMAAAAEFFGGLFILFGFTHSPRSCSLSLDYDCRDCQCALGPMDYFMATTAMNLA